MEEKKEISVLEKEAVEKEEGELTRPGIYYSPRCDIYETEEAITLTADIPGVTQEGLDIDLKENKLTIVGHVKEPEERFNPIYTEYGIGGYTRSFQIGDTINQSKINASLNDGVLSLVLPKADRLKPRKIEIST